MPFTSRHSPVVKTHAFEFQNLQTHSVMNTYKLGIKPKLLIAFGLILTTTLVASSLALNAFTRFSDAMTEINQESVLLMIEAIERTRMGLGISFKLPELTSSKMQKEARMHYESLVMSIKEV